MPNIVQMTMLETERDIARTAYERAKDARLAAQEAEAAALDEWSRARIALAEAKGHEHAGKRVRRTTTVARGGKRGPVTRTGTVTLWTDLRQGMAIRGHQPIPGEWFILSDGGRTGYRIPGGDMKADGWELDE